MAHAPSRNRIVVGVDGSAGSTAAVRWAVREAVLRHVTVDLVCSYYSDARLYAPYALRSWAAYRDERYAAARAGLGAAAGLARRSLPPGDLMTELVGEPPIPALLSRAEGAEMLVLGAARPDRRPGQPSYPLGPVARTCLRLAHCPVVVIGAGYPPATTSAAGLRHAG